MHIVLLMHLEVTSTFGNRQTYCSTLFLAGGNIELSYRVARPYTIKGRRNMDPNLHQKMGIHHLNRVLDYSRFVVEDGRATVHLTREDWQVVADTLFRMETPKEMLPEAIRDYRLTEGNQVIELSTEGCVISVDMM